MVVNDTAYDGSPLGEPDATASFTTAPSTAAALSCTEPPPLHPSAARAAECPPCSTTGRDREPFQIAQFRLELRAERDRSSILHDAPSEWQSATRSPTPCAAMLHHHCGRNKPHPACRSATLSQRRRHVATTPTPSWLGSAMTMIRQRTARRSCRPSPWYGLCTSPPMLCASHRSRHPPSWSRANRRR